MIQDIFPDIFHNEYRPQARPSGDSPVLSFRGQSLLAKLTKKGACEKETCELQFPTVDMISRQEVTGTLVYAFAVNDTEYFLNIWEHTPDQTERQEQPRKEVAKKSEQKEFTEQTEQVEPAFAYLDFLQIRSHMSNVCGMIVFTGYHLHMWYSGRRFCGYCGHPVVHDSKERAVCCPVCGQKNYPRIMPAVIVGVINEDRILVTKYKEGFRYYALIAGFTEIGETLEETVIREVQEETGLRVKNVRYYKSQPWGLAGDVLAGFYCDVDGDTSIRLDEIELKVAEWKAPDEIELQPDNYSLTNEMMRRFKEGKDC